jgi:hypothetical protein
VGKGGGQAVSDDAFPYIAGVIGGAICFVMLFVGRHIGESNTKQEAILAGVAYYTNDSSGMAQFKWKEAKP